MSNEIIKVDHLTKRFKTGDGWIHAVDDVSFDIRKGETLGLVGESGSGKSTLGKLLLRFLKPDGGEFLFKDEQVFRVKGARGKELCKEIQMIFQDPYQSLNPRMKVSSILAEGLRQSGKTYDSVSLDAEVAWLLEKVGLPADAGNRYPREFSGGQRQRIGIARALSVEPDFIVCDEAVSALDVSIQAQIINLLRDLQKDTGITYLFIAHNLSVVRYISDRILVMYKGAIMESGTAEEVYENPCHPYTRVLLEAIPVPDPKAERERERKREQDISVRREAAPEGCRYYGFCPDAMPLCKQCKPEIHEISEGHRVMCHLYKEGV